MKDEKPYSRTYIRRQFKHLENEIDSLKNKMTKWNKMSPVMVVGKLDKTRSDVRMLERKLKKCELREKQIIVLLKQILDIRLNRNKKITDIKDIIKYMNQLIIQEEEKEDMLDFDDIPNNTSKDGMIGLDELNNVEEVDIDEEKT